MRPLHRRQFIVDAKFQWTVIAYTFVVSLFTSVAQITISRLNALESMQATVSIGSMHFEPHTMILILSVFGYAGLFIIALLFSSRLSGPLFRLRKHMGEVSEGKEVGDIHFRRGDYYSDLSKSYNRMLESMPVKKKGKDKGFSLVEFIVVMAIMSVLAVIAVSSFTSGPTESAQFREEVTSFRDILNTARNLAISRNQCSFVRIVTPQEVEVRTYAMASDCTGVLPDHDQEVTRQFSPLITISNFSRGGGTLGFRPGGGTTQTIPITVRIASSKGYRQVFTVYPAIGQVRQM